MASKTKQDHREKNQTLRNRGNCMYLFLSFPCWQWARAWPQHSADAGLSVGLPAVVPVVTSKFSRSIVWWFCPSNVNPLELQMSKCVPNIRSSEALEASSVLTWFYRSHMDTRSGGQRTTGPPPFCDPSLLYLEKKAQGHLRTCTALHRPEVDACPTCLKWQWFVNLFRTKLRW